MWYSLMIYQWLIAHFMICYRSFCLFMDLARLFCFSLCDERQGSTCKLWSITLSIIRVRSSAWSAVISYAKKPFTGIELRYFNCADWNIKRDFYLDVYTILNRIKLTIWTICAFRVINPHQWSLSKQSSLKVEKDSPKVPKQAEVKRGGVITHKITISINFNTENIDALKTLRINRSRQ